MSSHGSATLTIDDIPASEKPQNGVAGLKHWKYDLLAGLQVAMMGIPLSLGIAIASGAPPVCGLISAIIAGFVFPFLGGAYITISGPAAGLAPALLAGMITLGNGDLAVGYPLLLVAIALVGVVQVILSIFNAGRFALFFPISVVEGMLMAIGMLIIIKQVPAFLGVIIPPIKSIPKAVISIPEQVMALNPLICTIGAVALFLLFFLSGILSRIQATWAKLVPVPMIVIVLGGLASWIIGIDEKYLIHVPLNVFEHGIVFPSFAEAFTRTDLYGSFLVIIITLVLIDGTESLATIQAIDKIDPFKRKSNPNVTLRAMGFSNTASSLLGGLTIIPGGLKSTVNMLAGGRTLWANFYYAIFQLIILLFAAALMNYVPKSALAGLLMWIGWKLCSPKVFKRIFSVGKEQIFIAVVNLVVTLWTSDLLEGMIAGVATKIVLLVKDVVRASPGEGVGAALKELFRDPVIRIGDSGAGSRSVMTVSATAVLRGTVEEMKNPYKIYLSSATCMNLVKLDAALKKIVVPEGMKANYMLILAGKVVDHTTMEYLHNFQDRAIEGGHTCVLVGMEHFRGLSDHALAYRISQTPGNLTAFA
ncbi:MAG TPA: SulP family inorganic anion transporter [Nitrospiraceae bacterium]|jgi:MFS superfamily sulfate permease-like transporter|nr:SulP family inorganic anion transporter [Nitrospiraceae bacterium]